MKNVTHDVGRYRRCFGIGCWHICCVRCLCAELKGAEGFFLKKIIKSQLGDFLLGRAMNAGGVIAAGSFEQTFGRSN